MFRAMSDSVYRKTPLPVRLNLSDRNTRDQLSTGVAEKESGRGALEGVGLASSASQSQKNCTEVMRKDLRDWMANNGMQTPPQPGEAEQRAMWTWMRDFHKEYNDDWFTRNMPRLHEKFRPVFMDEVKKMRAEMAAAAREVAQKAAPPVDDLLDFGPPTVASAPAPPLAAVETNGREQAVTMASAAPPTMQAGAGDALLDLDFSSPSPPPTTTKAPPSATDGKHGDLLDLMF